MTVTYPTSADGKAHYYCPECGRRWEQRPARVLKEVGTSCRGCGSLYVDWINYRDFLSDNTVPG